MALKTRIYGKIQSVLPGAPKRAPEPDDEPREKFWTRERVKKMIKPALITLAGLFLFGSVFVWWVGRSLPDPSKLNSMQVAQSTKIYDRTGTHLLYEIYGDQKRTVVEMNQISDWVKKATVAVEDKDFYNHSGIRVLSIARAGVNDIVNRALAVVGIKRRTGSGGASTLTQQLVKNTIVGNQSRGLAGVYRKIKEAILAIKLERSYSKEDILKLYLNQIPYGSTNYGIESAAQSYFRKSAKDLTLAESATLAGMVQSPSRFLNNPDLFKQRRNVVLRLMADQGYITEEQKKNAQAEDLRLQYGGILEAPHFVLYVKQQLAEQFGENMVDTGGLRVITTLDYDKQIAARDIVKTNGDKFAKEAKANNAALVALDPKTAQIVVMVGSRNFDDDSIDGKFNVIVLGKRQPGSSFKPFVYTAAFEKGFTPETVLYDVETEFARAGKPYSPSNYDGKEHGLLTMRKALQGSLNIPAVKTLYLVGIKDMIEFGKRFGYTTFNEDCGLSMVLGGCEVIPLEHANAYATLANNGVYHAPVSILKVTDAASTTLYEWKQTDGTEAVKPEFAATIASVLTDNNARAYMFGAVNNLILPDRAVAAKTGTTNNTRDTWTMGYVPSLAAGVWVGNSDNTTMNGTSNKLAAVIWNQFMRKALASTTPEKFPDPPANDATKPVLRGSDGGIKLQIDKATGKIATSSTPPELIETRSYLPPHDILYYVNKDDPRGPAPASPADDPQYQAWENALQSWKDRQAATGTPLSFEEPPTEYDAPQSPELVPTVSVVSPIDGSTLTSRDMIFEVGASSPRGVTQVIFFIDGSNIGSAPSYPFKLTYHATKEANGPHTLKVIARDDLGNSAAKEISFTLNADFDPASFEWFDGADVTIGSDEFPRTVNLNPFRWEDAKDLKVYLETDGSEKLIYTFTSPADKLFNNRLYFNWQHSPGVGNYTLKGVLTDKKGRTVEKSLDVEVK